jgi:hypothetical protein
VVVRFCPRSLETTEREIKRHGYALARIKTNKQTNKQTGLCMASDAQRHHKERVPLRTCEQCRHSVRAARLRLPTEAAERTVKDPPG